jgi:hypothetical protein
MLSRTHDRCNSDVLNIISPQKAKYIIYISYTNTVFNTKILRKRNVPLIKYNSVHKFILCMILIGNFFSMTQQLLVAQDLLNIEV